MNRRVTAVAPAHHGSPTRPLADNAHRSRLGVLGAIALLGTLAACSGDRSNRSPTAPEPPQPPPPAPQAVPASEVGQFIGTVTVLKVSGLDVRTESEQCALREIANNLQHQSGPLELTLEATDAGWIGWEARVASGLLGCGGEGCGAAWGPDGAVLWVEAGILDRTALAAIHATACPGEPIRFSGFMISMPPSDRSGHQSEGRIVYISERSASSFTDLLELRVALDLARQ